MTDGTLESEERLSYLRRLARRLVYKYSNAFIGASMGSMRLYNDYGKSTKHFFQSHLCANNLAFHPSEISNRPYDFMFYGRLSAEKNLIFVIDVAKGVAISLGRKGSLLILGSGQLESEVKALAELCSTEVDFTFKGFVQPDLLPDLYYMVNISYSPTLGTRGELLQMRHAPKDKPSLFAHMQGWKVS